MSKSPFTPEFREMVSKLFLDGESSIELSKKYGVAAYTIRKWALRYKEQGYDCQSESEPRADLILSHLTLA